MSPRSTHDNFYYLAKRWQLGKLAYQLYYAPRGLMQKSWQRGLWNTVLDSWYQQRMEQTAYSLNSTVKSTSVEPLEIYFLTGKKFWYQTCFCAYSMAQHTPFALCPVVYDDGSLERKYQEQIQRIFPNAKLILSPEIEQSIEEFLPEHQFPYLRERRLNYPNMRKLTDIHVGSQGWKLILDSDMLFFRSPDFLLNWLTSPQQPCHMVDVETAYGYSEALMSELAQAKIPSRLNVGICGLNSGSIDWEQLEHWCKTLIEQQGTHYYQEQALTAMLMASQDCAVAPTQDYIVMPDRSEALQPQAVMHHYVSASKPWYFRHGWKHVLQNDRSSNSLKQTA